MNEIFEMKNLLGLWMIDPKSTPEQIVTLEFKDNGQLIYTVIGDQKDEVILLTYRVENDTIVTDQPSAPKIEKTKFSFTPEGKLLLVYGNISSLYVRVPNINS